MAFYWSLSYSKFPQVSRTLLSILTDLNYAVVWIVSTYPLIYKLSDSFTKPLGIVSSVAIIISITIIFMFPSFFSSLARSKYLSLYSLSFIFTLWSARTAKSTIWQVLIFFYYHLVWSSS